MRKLNFIVAVIGIVGQLLGFGGIFASKSNEQLMLSLWVFLGFGCVCAIALLTDKKEEKNLQNVLQLQINYLSLYRTKKPKAMNTEKSIERFEKIMDKVSMPMVLLCATYLIGRTLASFVFGV